MTTVANEIAIEYSEELGGQMTNFQSEESLGKKYALKNRNVSS